MPKLISDQHIKQISQMIRNWPTSDSLDWNSVCLGAQEILGWDKPPTRQALDKKPLIKFAYTTKKNSLKSEKAKLKGVPKPRSSLDAMKQISRLQDENDALKLELAKMAEIANRFIHNASLAGLSRERLMAPLQTVSEAGNARRKKSKKI